MKSRRQKESVLLTKGSAEHERLFRAFVERRVVAWTDADRSGTARVARTEVVGVQHAGTKTRFDLHVLESGTVEENKT